MRIAICFDDLIQFGGAERLLLAVYELYPDACVYTSLASAEWIKRCTDLGIKLHTSFMQKLPLKKSLNRFYGLSGLHALAFESLRFDDADIVLSISSRFAHGIITKPGTVHVCYMNSPGRMFWEPYGYFQQEGDRRQSIVWTIAAPFLSFSRLWDYGAAQRVDFFIANSRTPRDRIKKYYRRDSTIIYPFVNDLVLGQAVSACPYYLVITRLNAWKRVDIAIKACQKLGVPLKIIGEGPNIDFLKKIAYDNVEFLGYVSEEKKIATIAACRALIVTQKEDFGIASLEAMALGKPVVAYRAGGALETVIEGVTGEFFDEQNPESLAKLLKGFIPSAYKSEACISQAAKFSKQKFLEELDVFLKKVYDSQYKCYTKF